MAFLQSLSQWELYADSSFTLVKKFGNIYPVKFDLNKSSPKFKYKKLDSIFNCYVYPYPLNSLEIVKDSVVIIKNLDMSSNLGYYYKFNSKLDDWILVDKQIFIKDNLNSVPFKKGILLSDFSYCTDSQ